MKKTLFITILLLLATIVVGLVIWSDKQSVAESVVNTNVATTSTMLNLPSPLTLASLQALPDWNPTMEVEGMKRVEDGNPELEVKGYTVHTEELSWTGGYSTSTFVIKYLEPEISVKACEKYGLTGQPSGYSAGYVCLIATPDLFNEVIITSKDTGEVLHKYRLKEGYSLVSDVYQREGGIMYVNAYDDNFLYLYISGWNFLNSTPENIGFIYHEYKVNILTGVVVEIPNIANSADVINHIPIPSPLTLASLQALPNWNPAMEVDRMKRVEDGNPELEVKNFPIHTEEIKSNNSSSTFVIKYLEPVVSAEACEKYSLSTLQPYHSGYNCLIAIPDLFNEVIITSKDTGEVLHKYRLKEGYSLAGGLNINPFEIINVNRFYDVKFLYILTHEWDYSNNIPKKIGINHSYKLNLLTGELMSAER